MQTDRRVVLKGIATLLMPGGVAVAAKSTMCPPPCGLIRDVRFAEGRARAGHVAHRGTWVRSFDADVTALWRDVLRPHWAAGRGTIEGITSASTLFCLEQMARDERYRTLVRVPLSTAEEGPIFWTIGRDGMA